MRSGVSVLVELRKLIEDLNLDILCIQEPYSWRSTIPHMPSSARVINNGENPKAAIVINKDIQVVKISQLCDTHTNCIEINTSFGSFMLVNSYYQFGEDLDLEKFRLVCGAYPGRPVILMADANSKSPWWFSSYTDGRGECFEELILEFGLYVENTPGNPPTFENRAGAKSNIDITLTNYSAHAAISGWRVGQGLTTSDHNIIYFDLNSNINRNDDEFQIKRHFNIKKAN